MARANKNTFHELVETAILGTDRKPLAKILASGDLGCTISAIGDQNLSPERILIDQLTALSIARKAGRLASTCSHTLPVCPVESREKVSERSLSLLIQVLTLEAKGSELKAGKIIAEWLRFCSQAEQRLPEEFVPRLLEWGRQLTDLHSLIEICSGEHYQWLLSLNEDWRGFYAKSKNIEKEYLTEKFDNGEQIERLRAFRELRRYWPEDALKQLTESFEKEAFENKVVFVKMLNDNLTLNDEAFLEEKALRDRRKEVRSQASAALNSLDGSRLMLRMIARADKYINVSRQNKLTVTLPDFLDDEMQRDGIVENLTIDSRMGMKANWLCQILSLVPPDHFEKRFNLSAVEFLKIVMDDGDWSLPISLALMAASAKFGGDMQIALLNCKALNLTDSHSGLTLLNALPHAEVERLILMKLPSWSQERTSTKSAPRLDLWYYLEQVDFNWSEAFTVAIMNFIIKESREKVPVFGHTFYSNASIFALRMHIIAGQLIEQIDINADAADIYRRNALERMIDTVRLRYEIFQSFNLSNTQLTEAH